MKTKYNLNPKILLYSVVALSLMVTQLGLMGSSVSATITSGSVSPSGIFFEPALQLGEDGTAFMQPFVPGSQWTAGDNAINGPIMDGYNSMYSIPAPAKPCVKRTIDSVTLKSKFISGEKMAPIGIGFMDAASPASPAGTNFIEEPQSAIAQNPDFHFAFMEAKGDEVTFVIALTSPKTYDQLKIVVGIDDGEGRSESLIYEIEDFSIKVSDDDSSCPNNNPSISPSSTTILSSTPSGSTVVAGSILKATDPDGDKLSYSITLGNDSNYFAIDTITGDITTTKTNIPAGTYTLTIQVDDGKGGKATAVVSIVVTDASTAAPENNASPSSNAKQMKPMLANTGHNMSTLAVISATLLSLVGYFKIKNNKKNRSYIKR